MFFLMIGTVICYETRAAHTPVTDTATSKLWRCCALLEPCVQCVASARVVLHGGAVCYSLVVRTKRPIRPTRTYLTIG